MGTGRRVGGRSRRPLVQYVATPAAYSSGRWLSIDRRVYGRRLGTGDEERGSRSAFSTPQAEWSSRNGPSPTRSCDSASSFRTTGYSLRKIPSGMLWSCANLQTGERMELPAVGRAMPQPRCRQAILVRRMRRRLSGWTEDCLRGRIAGDRVLRTPTVGRRQSDGVGNRVGAARVFTDLHPGWSHTRGVGRWKRSGSRRTYCWLTRQPNERLAG